MSSSIEWTDETWNPTVGCMKVSAGCEHCYAIRTAHRLAAIGQANYAGLTKKLPDASLNWTGVVRMLPERLSVPIGWKKPSRIFVDSMSDLFHEDVPDEFIERVFGAMATAHWHSFQVLTKRPQRMLAWFTERYQVPLIDGSVGWEGRDNRVWARRGDVLDPSKDAGWTVDGQVAAPWSWPLPNVWLGVSAEDQRAADERIPLLLQTPAAVRFLSCEPLLGPIELFDTSEGVLRGVAVVRDGGRSHDGPSGPSEYFDNSYSGIDWVIAGGESGPRYRPMDIDWARTLRDQCQAAGVAFHFKQHGGRTHSAGGRDLDGRTWDEYPATREAVPV